MTEDSFLCEYWRFRFLRFHFGPVPKHLFLSYTFYPWNIEPLLVEIQVMFSLLFFHYFLCRTNRAIKLNATFISIFSLLFNISFSLVLQVVNESTVDTVKKDGKRRRINSGGTLSPCDSFASDDLMLDFETNSLEETAGR